jgi:hypothetical protein
MTTRAKNWILRPYLDSAHWIEEESTILFTDTFCVLTSVIGILLSIFRRPDERLQVFFNVTETTEIYPRINTLSLLNALPIALSYNAVVSIQTTKKLSN